MNPPTLRCHKCGTPTDFADPVTTLGICMVCAKASLGPIAPGVEVYTCNRCHNATTALIGVNDDPHLCLDCQHTTLLQAERAAL